MSTLALPKPEQLAMLCRRWKVRELSLFGTAQLRIEVSELFGRPVDLVRERNITNPYRLASIRRNRRSLYAA